MLAPRCLAPVGPEWPDPDAPELLLDVFDGPACCCSSGSAKGVGGSTTVCRVGGAAAGWDMGLK
jgi:hypothetical protein